MMGSCSRSCAGDEFIVQRFYRLPVGKIEKILRETGGICERSVGLYSGETWLGEWKNRAGSAASLSSVPPFKGEYS